MRLALVATAFLLASCSGGISDVELESDYLISDPVVQEVYQEPHWTSPNIECPEGTYVSGDTVICEMYWTPLSYLLFDT